MCGGFAGLYAASDQTPFLKHVQYHVGRLITYLTLGLIAGGIGRSIDSISGLAGIQRFASVLVGIALIGFGLKSLFANRSAGLISNGLFKYLTAPLHRLLQNQKKHPVKGYPLLLGIVSTLLPCGWLYGYVAVAAATGSIWRSVLVMLFFWIGTIPLLLGIGFGVHKALPFGQRSFPRLAGILLVLAGAYSLSNHLQAVSHDSGSHGGGCAMHESPIE